MFCKMAAKILMDMPGGKKMPAIGLGTWQVSDESELVNALNTALETGYRHIDTAFVYQNEAIIGKVLQEWFSSGRLKREDVYVTTKLPAQGVHKDRVESFLSRSLASLQLDYVDLYLVHFPICVQYKEGVQVPISELEADDFDHLSVWKKMEEQVAAGRTKAIGISNFNKRQIDRVLKNSTIKPSCLQVELHVYLQQRELVDFCHQNGIVVVAYSPLGSPAYNKFLAKIGSEAKELPDILNDRVVTGIANKHKKTKAQVMLRYLLERNIVAIPKSVTPKRIKENIDVFDFALDSDDMKALNALDRGEEARVCDFKQLVRLVVHPEWPFPK
ncbi:hypothetical protein NQ317_013903 [Molorchus minor]|uniref:NADP-dependent oxidoreductase domain-containing protein n=1 Tax=Molorchus minor TaxID=1323400 RepID=A0ABQ9K836_9CUCU|nr:hypothetical protein NQ317_013903 [Molorchus minor]